MPVSFFISFETCANLFVGIEKRKVLFVLLVKGFEHFKAFVVHLFFQLEVGVESLFGGDIFLYVFKGRNKPHTDSHARCGTDRAYVLRIVNRFDDVSRDGRQAPDR